MTETPNTRHVFDLEERTLRFAKGVIRVCKSIQPDVIDREVISQLVRASGSVGANYREANDALSKKDFGHRIRITRREAKEAQFWLQLLHETSPSSQKAIRELLEEAVELRKIFSSIAGKAANV